MSLYRHLCVYACKYFCVSVCLCVCKFCPVEEPGHALEAARLGERWDVQGARLVTPSGLRALGEPQ